MAEYTKSQIATRRAVHAAQRLKNRLEKVRLMCAYAIDEYLEDKSGTVELELSLFRALRTLYLMSNPDPAISLAEFTTQLQSNPENMFQLRDGRYVFFEGNVSGLTHKPRLNAIISRAR